MSCKIVSRDSCSLETVWRTYAPVLTSKLPQLTSKLPQHTTRPVN